MKTTISQKIAAVNILFAIITMVMGGVGFWGISSLSDNLKFIANKAWDAADGSMEATINIQQDIIELQKKLLASSQKPLSDEYSQFRDAAIERMFATGLFTSKMRDELDLEIQQYDAVKQKVLQKIKSGQGAGVELKQFNEEINSLLALLGDMEETGDSQVEGRQQTIETLTSNVNYTFVIAMVVALLLVAGFTWSMRRSVIAPLKMLVTRFEDISQGEGDLKQTIDVSSGDEIADVAQAYNKFLEKIRHIVVEIKSAALAVDQKAEGFSDINTRLKQNVSQQQEETQIIAAAINEMAASISEVAQNAGEASNDADQADKLADEGRRIVTNSAASVENLADEVRRAVETLSRLDEQSQQIESVLDVIKTIAEQTNLLALNAAIEAARAGEQGRGFAVVADEVRTLASRTQDSTQEIQSMIEALQEASKQAVGVMQGGDKQARETVDLVNEANEALKNITQSITNIAQRNAQIAAAAEQQSSVAEDVNRSIDSIASLARNTDSYAYETSKAGDELNHQAKNINDLVGAFKT